MIKQVSIGIISALFCITAQAKIFRNAYISFEMPETWKCALEQTEWVCRAEQGKQMKEAIIILTAKEVGPTDSFPLYEQHLNQAMPASPRNGNTESKVQYQAKKVQINDQPWIDGLHMGSEVGNYYTRYVATIKEKIAILVTLSAHKTVYANYSGELNKTVQSLRVIATKDLLSRPDLGPIRPGSETLGGSIGQAMPQDMMMDEGLDGQNSGANANQKKMLLGIAALVALVLGLLLYLKAKKK